MEKKNQQNMNNKLHDLNPHTTSQEPKMVSKESTEIDDNIHLAGKYVFKIRWMY